MNTNNAAQYLPFVQALADGKTIQLKAFDQDEWGDIGEVEFRYPPECYRIKPDGGDGMKQWTVIWKASDVDDYEYSYIEANEPESVFEHWEMDIVQHYLKVTAQNSNVQHDSVCSIVCIIEGHVGVNFQ